MNKNSEFDLKMKKNEDTMQIKFNQLKEENDINRKT